MAIRLKQSTASQEVPLGPFLSSSDGTTPQTALSIANTDIKLWKTGATTLASKNSGGATHISGGIYYAVLDATDTDTLGPMVIYISVSGALPTRTECEVLAANIYDSLIGGGDYLQVDVAQFGNTNATTASGRPEVNTSHIAGSAVSTASAQIGVNVVSYASGQAPLQPTVSGRTLDVSVGGEAGLDWANVGSPTTAVGLTGTTISTTQTVASVSGAVGSVTGLTASNLDAAISTRLASASYTAPDNASITGIKAKTDSLTFTVAGQVDANIQSINDVTVTGNGQSGTEFGV